MAASPHPPLKVLILGGSSEATVLGRALAGDPRFAATISLAGRTRSPAPQPVPSRIGGFGGAAGLARHLAAAGIDALVDATHPFATRISRNAAEAAGATGIPLLAIRRPPWQPVAGDCWIPVPDMAAAAAALGPSPRRVLLTVGQKDLAPFAAAPQHDYLIRSVDPPPPDAVPPGAEVITARGPFLETDETRLMAARRIDILVTKNSGGSASGAKLGAARALGLPVVMVARPATLAGADATVAEATVAEALAWLERHHAMFSERGA